MASYQIVCVVPDSSDPGRRIDAVGVAELGQILSIDQAIALHDQGDRFWTIADGIRANVYVHGGLLTSRYMTTSPDGFGPNNLLKLPPCYR